MLRRLKLNVARAQSACASMSVPVSPPNPPLLQYDAFFSRLCRLSKAFPIATWGLAVQSVRWKELTGIAAEFHPSHRWAVQPRQ